MAVRPHSSNAAASPVRSRAAAARPPRQATRAGARPRGAGIAVRMRPDVTIDTERVWGELHTKIRAFVNRRVRRAADVDDIVQRIFLQVHRSLPTLRDADRLHAWIYQMTRRAIADHYRAPVHRHEVPAGAGLDVVPNDVPGAGRAGEDESLALQELAARLQPLLADFTQGDQEALRLVEVDGLTQNDAARRLGLSVSGMKSRVQRARRRLRSAVEACCRLEIDRRGGLIAYEPRGGGRCEACGSDRESNGADPVPAKAGAVAQCARRKRSRESSR